MAKKKINSCAVANSINEHFKTRWIQHKRSQRTLLQILFPAAWASKWELKWFSQKVSARIGLKVKINKKIESFARFRHFFLSRVQSLRLIYAMMNNFLSFPHSTDSTVLVTLAVNEKKTKNHSGNRSDSSMFAAMIFLTLLSNVEPQTSWET